MSTEEEEYKKSFLVNRDAEPQVICNELLNRLIKEQGHKGEAGRLCRNVEINLDNITVLKIEWQNILLIDHLWKLSNLQVLSLKCNKIDKIENLNTLTKLRELDISFNFIERIENLECLTRLEFLSLFGNRIRRMENLDTLVNLVRLSLGNNQIESLENLQRLRFMRKLYSLNLEGNPVVENFRRPLPFHVYVAAILPELKYYNYQLLDEEERAEGSRLFRNELRLIEEAEAEEIEQKSREQNEAVEEQRLSTCFVEGLNEYHFFDILFVGDNSAKVLLMVEGTNDILKTYREQVFTLTQKIFKLGLEKHESRMENIAEFKQAVDTAAEQSQMQSIKIVNDFLEAERTNKENVEQLNELLLGDSENPDAAEKINSDIAKLNDDFTSRLDETWYELMDLEMTTHERIDEGNDSFGQTIQDMLHEFVESAQIHFVEIGEAETEFSERLHEFLLNWLSEEAATAEQLDPELKKCQVEKDHLANKVATSREYRMQVIDKREEKLVSRSRAWVAQFMDENHLNEQKRNRAKLVEIHDFIEEHRASYASFLEDLAG